MLRRRGDTALRGGRQPAERAPGDPVWIWGAGHVGRAITGVLAPLPIWRVTWVDTSRARFPEHMPDGVTDLSPPIRRR
jgi:xanthine dehydrogenase accessory factor